AVDGAESRRRPRGPGPDVRKPHIRVTKCRFTVHPARPDCSRLFPARKTRFNLESRTMSRRTLVYAALVITSVVVSACSQPTAPRRDDTTCRSIQGGSGNKCPNG